MLDTWENDTMTYSPDMDAVFLNKFCIFLEIRQIRILKYFVKTRLKRLSAYKRDQFTDKNDIKFMIEKHYKSETKT